jgi:hypothetical protein
MLPTHIRVVGSIDEEVAAMGGSMSSNNGPAGKEWGWWRAIIAGVIAAIVGGVIGGVILQFIRIGGPKVSAIVDFGYWTTPRCVKDTLLSYPYKLLGLGETMDPFLEAKSMYHITVSNKKGSIVENAQANIPDAYYVVVVNDGEPNDYWRLPNNKDKWVPLGNIQSEHNVEINAWTTNTPDRDKASTIKISHDDGSASPRIKTPVGFVAEWAEWIIGAAVVLSIIVVSFIIYRHNFLCSYFCISRGQK